jgi:drug/metabolite transporter (DMT)-like permease
MARAGATGLIEPGLAYAVGVPGLALTTAGNAAVIAALEPVFVLFGVWLLYGNRPGATGMGAVATAVAGVALVSLPAAGGLGAGSLPGDALVLLGTALAAVYVLASSRLAPTMPALLLTALQQTAGLILAAGLTAAALVAGWQALPAQVDAAMLALAVAAGLIQYALAFWLYLVGLKGLPPGLAGVFLTLTPVFGVMGGVLFLGETVAASQMAGIALVILSLGVLLRSEGR